MNKKETEDCLLKIFDNVNYWVDYADKKSSYIITLFTVLSAFITFILNKYNDYIIVLGSFIFIIFYIISLFLLLCSLLPITNKFKNINSKSNINKSKDNLLYFGDIAKYDNDSYKTALYNRYQIVNSDNYILDLINQIVINSKITYRKFKLSERICCLLFIGLGIYLFSIVAYFINKYII